MESYLCFIQRCDWASHLKHNPPVKGNLNINCTKEKGKKYASAPQDYECVRMYVFYDPSSTDLAKVDTTI